MTRPPTALTIAGSDPSGGAGIQVDLRTFAAHGVYGLSTITAVTAQNTRGVVRTDVLPPDAVAAQLRALLDDLPVDAVKIGMLGSRGNVEAVSAALEALGPDAPPIVVDPVLASTGGVRLLAADARASLVDRLLPLATVITPNRAEAALLAGVDPTDIDALVAWARGIGPAVVLTGGDADTPDVVDTLVAGPALRTWSGPRLRRGAVHGTGCALSSSLAARLARGTPLETAVGEAIAWVRGRIANAVPLGHGAALLP